MDHCVPASVAKWLRAEHHETWTAFEAHLHEAPDDALVAYAAKKNAALVSTNRDCAATARRMQLAAMVWLSVTEVDCVLAMQRAVEWINTGQLPVGRVLKVQKHADLKLLAPPNKVRRA